MVLQSAVFQAVVIGVLTPALHHFHANGLIGDKVVVEIIVFLLLLAISSGGIPVVVATILYFSCPTYGCCRISS